VFLNNLWFVLIAVLWIGYFVLEGFDFGVGALLRIVGKNEKGRRVLINTIGPVWDANEVWLLTAGGATFAAFPEWYASMFSGFYLALVLILVLLIVRGVAFEYRGKGHSDQWRARWDWSILITSWGLALLWGVAFGNVVRGVALDADHEYVGTFLDLLNPFALLMGVTTLLLFLTHGSMLVAVLVTRADRDGWAFLASAVSTAMLVTSWFASIYPDVFPSTIDPAYSLTIENAASTPYTLTLMSWIALLFVPLILAYQAWSYWIFRKRISTRQIPESPTSVPSH